MSRQAFNKLNFRKNPYVKKLKEQGASINNDKKEKALNQHNTVKGSKRNNRTSMPRLPIAFV